MPELSTKSLYNPFHQKGVEFEITFIWKTRRYKILTQLLPPFGLSKNFNIKDRLKMPTRHVNFLYYLFVLYTVLQGIAMLRDGYMICAEPAMFLFCANSPRI